jgi:hypothetical protein
MKENIISKETSEKTVLVGLITPQQNEAKANEYLDELGKDGWEACAVVPNGDTIVVYLKREKR